MSSPDMTSRSLRSGRSMAMIAAVVKTSSVAPPISKTARAMVEGASDQVPKATHPVANHRPNTNAPAIMISRRCIFSTLVSPVIVSFLLGAATAAVLMPGRNHEVRHSIDFRHETCISGLPVHRRIKRCKR